MHTACLPVGNDEQNAVRQIKRYFRSDAGRYDVIQRRRRVARPDEQLARPEVDELESIAGDVSVEDFRRQRYADSGRQL